MTQYLGSDTLAELVWSPRTGLNIKFAEKPCFLWEAGPSDIECNMSKNTQNEEHIASLTTCHVTEKVASCTGSQNQGAKGQFNEQLFQDGITSGREGSGYESMSRLKIEPMMQCRPDQHDERADVEMDTAKMEKDDCFSDPFLENAQVESHGSMESCKSANFLTTRKRKCSFEQRFNLQNKRIKNQTDGSSFKNWISNMLKGLKNHNGNDPRVGVCDGSRSFDQRKHYGFQNVFRSLFSPETIKQFEKKSIGSLNESNGSLGFVKHISFYEQVTKEAPKDMFDTIRKLRLSRTDILKWMNSRSSVAHLDGFFLRLRVAKWVEGEGGSRYYVACITGSQGATPWKNSKQSICVKVGDVECIVQSQYVSNCDFLEDELIAWWQKTSRNGGIPVLKNLKFKLAERRTLGM